MAERKKKKRAQEIQLGFEAITIEGGLLSPEWLSRVAQLNAGMQSESDYRIPKGLNLRDEIGRYWRVAQAHWNEFSSGRSAKADAHALATRFVGSLLRESFGYSSLVETQPAIVAERKYPIGLSTLNGRVPVVVAPAASGLDTLATTFGDGTRRRSAFGLAQEYLNAQDGALWGLSCDGVTLRIVRDNASLTRPAWIEADLQRIFTEERYADFAALWLLAHETRFGRVEQPVTECALEVWRNSGREEGTRAREHLRRGVEDALFALGQGFLAHPDNHAMRGDLRGGSLTTKAYFNELLRLVYRLIFVLTVEERGLLHAHDASEEAKALYAAGYSLRRLRDRSVKRSAHDRFSDLWESMKVALKGVACGEPRLGLPALAGIFSANQCPHLDAAKLQNRALLLAVFKLAWLREDDSLVRVNWRDMGPEELGSVYESLLELVPQIASDGRQFSFATGGDTKGNARKTTGSYYTPDSLVQLLLDSALEPVIAETIAKHPDKPIEALLGLSIVDPACGSGHFLLAAARRLASHIARIQANGTPSAADYRHALRQVVGRCIYGVDLNLMAVELCKVSLWMEAVEPGLPLTFLNSHIQHGNALLGTTAELMARGVPDAAWEPIEGDDKKVGSLLKKRNKAEAGGQRTLTFTPDTTAEESRAVVAAVRDLESAPDADIAALSSKETKWEDILESQAYRHQKFVADAWCAAFVWPKQAGELADAAPTNELWRQLRDGQTKPPGLTMKMVGQLANEYRFFHWHLQFPQVFANGGFDVVLGNPPWERVKLQEQEFFASRSEEIAKAVNAAARKKLIARLPEENPRLWEAWAAASRSAEGESHSIRQSGRYPLCGKGDVNTYAIFAEHNQAVLSPRGRAGFIVPSGIATDDTTKDYFGALVGAGRLASLFDYRNHDRLFYDVGHRRFKFCLFTATGTGISASAVSFVFFAESAEDVHDSARRFTLAPSDIELLNPNTRTSPTFRSRRDADINLAMYRRAGILWRESDEERGNPWNVRFMAMFHMSGDSDLFRTRADMELAGASREGNRFVRSVGVSLPLVEAKMVHHFDHRYGDYTDKPAGSQDTQLPDVPEERLADPSYQTMPRYWVEKRDVDARLNDVWKHDWLIGWRDICRSTDERTVISSLIPRSAVGDKFLLILPRIDPRLAACLYASLCSFPLDYAARQKVGGTSLKYFTMRQLPVLRPDTYQSDTAWDRGTTLRDWILPRVLELTYTAWDLRSFACDVGFHVPPFEWRSQRRFDLRCELDAAFFRLYGLSKDDVTYVMETFPIVRRNDEKANHGVYRTKEVILSIYDELVAAERSGISYRTRLSPPPAHVSLTHPARAPLLPAMPSVIPHVQQPTEEGALVIWALLYAAGGTITRTELARAFTLRARPELLKQLAPASLAQASEWASRVGARAVPQGLLAGTLRTLADRAGVALGTDGDFRATVTTTANSPAEERIDPWFRFEAQLALQVLRAQPMTAFKAIDDSLAGHDRELLEKEAS
jgi:hypothetical protein